MVFRRQPKSWNCNLIAALFCAVFMVSCAHAQVGTKLASPVRILPNNGTLGKIEIPNASNLNALILQNGSIDATLTGTNFSIQGSATTDGRIFLQGGNVSGLSYVAVDAVNTSDPALVVFDANNAGTTNGASFRFANGTQYFKIDSSNGGEPVFTASTPLKMPANGVIFPSTILFDTGYTRAIGTAASPAGSVFSSNLRPCVFSATHCWNITNVTGGGSDTFTVADPSGANRMLLVPGTAAAFADPLAASNLAGGGTQCLQALNSGEIVLSGAGCGGGGGGLPVPDTTIITQNASDSTKQFRFSNASITTGTTRVATVPDFNFIMAGINQPQTFTADQTFQNVLFGASRTYDVGSFTSQVASVYAAHLKPCPTSIGCWDISANNALGDVMTFTNPSGTNQMSIGPALVGVNVDFSANGNILPGTGSSFDLGLTGSRWRDLWLSRDSRVGGNEYIAGLLQIIGLGGSGTRCLTVDNAGDVLGITCPSGTGTVTSVGETFTGGLITVAGSPVTSSGAFALTVAGTSGGIPYFSSSSAWASSATLTANLPIFGGGAGSTPFSGTRSGNTTQVVTTTGTQTNGNCVSIDASGNHIASGAACGLGTLTSVTASSIAGLSSSGGTTPNISQAAASGSQNGYLTNVFFTTFFNKADPNLGNLGTTAANANINPQSSGSLQLGTTGLRWGLVAAVDGNYSGTVTMGVSSATTGIINGTLTVQSALAGTFSMTGNMTVGSSANFYNRTFAGALGSCSGVADGWMGVDTTNFRIYVCSGGTVKYAQLI